MNNETAPILEELKQECKAIKKSQTELRTALVEQQNTKPQDDTQTIPRNESQNQRAPTFLFWRH